MIDRQTVETILCRRFPDLPLEQVAAAANAIVAVPDEWEEVSPLTLWQLQCEHVGALDLRVFRRRAAERRPSWRRDGILVYG
jgi:hypothetical protein